MAVVTCKETANKEHPVECQERDGNLESSGIVLRL